MLLPLGRNVTLNFLVAGLYFTSSIYGLLPPIFLPSQYPNEERFLVATLLGMTTQAAARSPPVSCLAAPCSPHCSSSLRQDAASLRSIRQFSCASGDSRCRPSIPSPRLPHLQF